MRDIVNGVSGLVRSFLGFAFLLLVAVPIFFPSVPPVPQEEWQSLMMVGMAYLLLSGDSKL